MNPFKFRDAFYWKDQISVDSSYWANQRNRVDKLEFIASFQTAILGALAVGLIVATVRLEGVIWCIQHGNEPEAKDDYYTMMARKYATSTKYESEYDGLEHGDISSSTHSF